MLKKTLLHLIKNVFCGLRFSESVVIISSDGGQYGGSLSVRVALRWTHCAHTGYYGKPFLQKSAKRKGK